MKVLIICVGSRGDNEPFISLSSALTHRGHSVDIFTQTDAVHLLPRHNLLRPHSLPFTQQDFYRFLANPSHGADDPNPRVRFLGVVADCIGELVLPCAQIVLAVAKADKPDVIIASTLARQIALAIGEKVRAPVAWLHLQPLTPTSAFPHYSRQDAFVEAVVKLAAGGEPVLADAETNFASYVELERALFGFLQERVAKMCTAIGMASVPEFERDVLPAVIGHRTDVLAVNAFSNRIFPACADHAALANVVEAGALAAAYTPAGWRAPPELAAFLQECRDAREPPVCIGFGSMPFGQPQALVDALRRTGHKAVLVGAALASKEADDDGKTFRIDSVPYAWLLPQCAMMLSHGGAGVLHATLRAGIPALIAPLMGDQFAHAELVERFGWGARCGKSLGAITADDVVVAIERADACRERCRKVGEQMRSDGDGAEWLSGTLEERFAKSDTP